VAKATNVTGGFNHNYSNIGAPSKLISYVKNQISNLIRR